MNTEREEARVNDINRSIGNGMLQRGLNHQFSVKTTDTGSTEFSAVTGSASGDSSHLRDYELVMSPLPEKKPNEESPEVHATDSSTERRHISPTPSVNSFASLIAKEFNGGFPDDKSISEEDVRRIARELMGKLMREKSTKSCAIGSQVGDETIDSEEELNDAPEDLHSVADEMILKTGVVKDSANPMALLLRGDLFCDEDEDDHIDSLQDTFQQCPAVDSPNVETSRHSTRSSSVGTNTASDSDYSLLSTNPVSLGGSRRTFQGLEGPTAADTTFDPKEIVWQPSSENMNSSSTPTQTEFALKEPPFKKVPPKSTPAPQLDAHDVHAGGKHAAADDVEDDDSVLSDISGLTGVFTDFRRPGKKAAPLNPPFTPKPPVSAPTTITAKTKTKAKKNNVKVSFISVEVREYIPVPSSHPNTTYGCGVGIGWAYNIKDPFPIDAWESKRKPRKPYQLVIDRSRRELILKKWGYSEKEIAACVREINKVKRQRRQTVNNLKDFGVAKMEEAVETATKRLKNLFSVKKSLVPKNEF